MSTRMEGLRRRLRRAADRIQTESVDERQGRYARMSRQGKRVEARRLLSALAEDHPVRVYGGTLRLAAVGLMGVMPTRGSGAR